MEFSSSFKKTFKSQNSHRRGISIADEDAHHEQRPILSDHNMEYTDGATSATLQHRHSMPGSVPEVIVKIDGGHQSSSAVATPNKKNHNGRRETSLDIWQNDPNNAMLQREGLDFQEDPPSKLIRQFLNKQKAVRGETLLDVDLEMDELGNSNSISYDYDKTNHSHLQTSKELRVPIQGPNTGGSNIIDICADEQKKYTWSNGSSSSSDEDDNQRVHNMSTPSLINHVVSNEEVRNSTNEGSVLKCTSIQRRVSGLGRLKTRSRLVDPPEGPDRRSGVMKSGQLRSGLLRSGLLVRSSGMLPKLGGDEEDDDPLFDEDLPDDYKKAKFDALTIAQWISLVLIVMALVCTLVIQRLKMKKLRGLSLWKWEVLVLVLICGRLVSGWGIRIVVFLFERNFFMRKRILYFVYGVRKAVQNCIWLGLVLTAWRLMFDKKVDGNNKFLQYVNKLMLCMLIGTLLWLVKTLMVKVLASSFHVSTFFDRIQESLFNQYVIETLSGPPLIEKQNDQEEVNSTMAEIQKLQNAGATLPPDLMSALNAKVTGNGGGGLPPRPPKEISFRISGQFAKKQDIDQGISIDQLHKLNNKNVSAWNMKRLINVVKNGALSTLDEQALDTSAGDDASKTIKSECEAKAAARKIFRNVAKPRAKKYQVIFCPDGFIYLEDLTRFLQEEEALKTLNIVEGSPESEKISKSSLKNWVVNAFRERKALALTLNDTKTAVKKLHQMVNVIVGIIILIICLLILEIATSKFLLFMSSEIVVVAFIFGNTCKTVFEDVIFVFVIHPFDVGDRCEVDGVQMIVEEMNILTTVFLRADNQKIVYPNVTLATRPIGNYYRSPDMGDSIDFTVHIATPTEKIAIIKQRIISHIENKSDHWYPSPSVVLMNMEDLHRLKLSVWVRHRMNHQDIGEKWKRRGLLVEELVKICKELDIEYRLYPLDINIRAMPPQSTSTRIPSAWTTPPSGT